MIFKELHDQAKIAMAKYSDARDMAISSACEKLLPVFEKLAGSYKEPYVDRYDDKETWINLRYVAPLGIRYCGRFINVIVIDNDASIKARNRIQLLYASYESYDDYSCAQCFPDDTYFGESADERYDRMGVMPDWENFESLVRQLKVYFINSPLYKEYEDCVRDILGSQEVQSLTAADMEASSINENIELLFKDFFKKFKFYNPRKKKHFVRFPENVSLRYRGRFHNCLLIDDYAVSLGYIQHNMCIQEVGYNQDPYTIGHDFDRYIDKTYVLLHEVSLTWWPKNIHDFMNALRCLKFMFGENLERIEEDAYISASSVKYIKTCYTD